MHFACFEAVLSNCQENYMDVLIKSLLSVFKPGSWAVGIWRG